MKILYVNSLFRPHIGGGAEIILEENVQAMRSKGHEVAVLTIGPAPGLNFEWFDGVPVWRAGYKNLYFHHRSSGVARWRRLLWHLRDRYNGAMKHYVREVVTNFRPDVASCHNLAGWSISVWDELNALGVPIVQVIHDHYLLCAKSTMFRSGDRCVTRCLSCRMLRSAHSRKSDVVSGVVGVSEYMREKFDAENYFSRASVKTAIHNVRTLSGQDCSPRVADGTVVFGFIGTLAPNKGVELLLRSFAKTAQASWRLIVAGTGLDEYESQLRERYKDSRISFVGRVDPSVFYPLVDATVVPSVWDEPLGMVVAESLIHGRAVLASKRGGIPEMIDATCSILFEPTVEGIGIALTSFANDIEYWQSNAGRVQSRGLAFTDVSTWAANYTAVFESVVRTNGLTQ